MILTRQDYEIEDGIEDICISYVITNKEEYRVLERLDEKHN